jgi:hypothetical protein
MDELMMPSRTLRMPVSATSVVFIRTAAFGHNGCTTRFRPHCDPFPLDDCAAAVVS